MPYNITKAIAYVTRFSDNPYKARLSLCKPCRNADSLIQSKKLAINLKKSMPALLDDDTLMKYTATHEYGHMLQQFRYAEHMRKSAVKMSYDMFAYKDKCDIIEIAKQLNPSFSLEDEISDSCRKNDREFFAEVFANSQLGQPNTLGKAMNIWLALKGY